MTSISSVNFDCIGFINDMKVSLSWLKDYVQIELGFLELADALTMAGLEVEAVYNRYEYLNSVLVGRVVSCKPHCCADNLQVCEVDLGKNFIIPVVCGAPNVKIGMLTPVALPGTKLPDGFILEKTIIKNKPSEGMLCSEAELGLGVIKDQIYQLSSDLIPGDNLIKALDLQDTVYDISLTPNRPDCLSIIGIAREIAALQNTPLKYPEIIVSDKKTKNGNTIFNRTSVKINAPDFCQRYCARLVEDVTVSDSSFWIQDRLMSVGLKPINNIVDITNFVMMETGQPLHAFDFDRLAENRIIVQTAKHNQVFTALDNKDYSLSSDMLMICDADNNVAIAGIMGGCNSEIGQTTSRVLIESAYFNPTSVRRTSKKLGLSSEASYRFERGVDPNGIITALNRAAMLISETGKATVINGTIDNYPKPIPMVKPISLNTNSINRYLGTDLDKKEIKDFLEAIEFKVTDKNSDTFEIVPPSFRVDVSRPVDLIEEIARMTGYDKIPVTYPLIPAKDRKLLETLDLQNRIKDLMICFGFTEVINYSFVNRSVYDKLNLGSDDIQRNIVEILNPLSEDQSVMRTSLVPGILETVQRNISRRTTNLMVFEVGNIFINKGKNSLPEEIEMMSGVCTGLRSEASWHCNKTECDFYDIKGVVERLISFLNIKNVQFTMRPRKLCNYTKYGNTAQVTINNKLIGLVGEMHPTVCSNFNIKSKVFIFELNMYNLKEHIPQHFDFIPVSKFPSITRDITIIVDKNVEAGSVIKSIKNIGEKLVDNILLSDVFEDHPTLSDKKSISLKITYRSPTETLEDNVINNIHKNISDKLLKQYNAMFPTQS